MGLTKDLMERLGGDPEACLGRAVCTDCFADPALKGVVQANARYLSCDFCGAEGGDPIAADLCNVVEHINRCLEFYYNHPENCLPYETAEGGYLGSEVWQTVDVVDMELELPNDESKDLRKAIIRSLGDRAWCRKHPFGLTEDERLGFSWEDFCEFIKHERRYFFRAGREPARGPTEEILNPGALLDELGRLFHDCGLVAELQPERPFFRAHKRTSPPQRTAFELGPPTREQSSRNPNRMSPAGIVMFYASESRETAVREKAKEAGVYVVGRFEATVTVPIVDLTQLPEPRSIFDDNDLAFPTREDAIFMHRFAEDIGKPIEQDERVHVEYVPTQVVTEYIRTAIRSVDGRRVAGIRYPSAMHEGGSCLVLFADRSHLIPSKSDEADPSPAAPQQWIRLTPPPTEQEVTEAEAAAWESEAAGRAPLDDF